MSVEPSARAASEAELTAIAPAATIATNRPSACSDAPMARRRENDLLANNVSMLVLLACGNKGLPPPALRAYSPSMRLIRNFSAVTILGLLAASSLAGCSGINATQSISPLNFLIPGFIRANPPVPPQVPAGMVVEVLV